MPSDRYSLLFYRVSLAGCALGAVATLHFLDGLAGYPGGAVDQGVTALVSAAVAFFFLYVFFFELREPGRLGIFFWSLLLVVLILEIALGFLPPTARDELTHHLALPRVYGKAGRIFEIPFAPYSYYPMLLDMLYVPWVGWQWDFVPKFIHGLYGFLTGLMLYAYLARRLSPVYGLLGFLFFLTTPAILRLTHWAYVDLGTTFYSTASLLCVTRWLENRDERKWLALAGLSAGLTMATKPNGLLATLVLALLLAFALGKEKEKPIRTRFGHLFSFLVLAFIAFCPWMVKNLIWTGNPFFPLLGNLFPSTRGIFGGEGDGLSILERRDFLYGENGWQIAALPLRIFFSGQDDAPQFFDGVLNPMLILFLPWAFKGKWADEKKRFFAFAGLYLLYALFLVEIRIRYILPIVPPLVILLVYGIHNLYLRIARPAWLVAPVTLLWLWNGVYLADHVRAVSPWDYFLGREGRDAYLSRMLPDYPAIQYINRALPPNARIYFLFTGRRVYYSERDYFHDPGENAWVLARMIQTAHDASDLNFKLAQSGATHLLVREDLLQRFLNDNLAPEQSRLWGIFAQRHLQGLFQARGYSVYQIHG